MNTPFDAIVIQAARVRELAPRLGPAVVATVLCTVLLLGSALVHPTTQAVGGAVTEAPVHLWGLWSAASGLWTHGPFVRHVEAGWPSGFTAHLMDPINLLVFLPAYWLGGSGVRGAVLGWNLLHLVTITVGAVSIVRLARRLVGPQDGWAPGLAVLVFCGTPFLLHTPNMGRSEYLPVALYPLHLALLHEWMRRPASGQGAVPAAAPRLRVGVMAGLTLGAVCLGGWYLSVFCGILNIVVGLAWSWRLRVREAVWRLLLVAAIGAACLVPAMIAFWAHPGNLHTAPFSEGWTPVVLSRDWYPAMGIDELFRLTKGRDPVIWNDLVPYVGVVSLALGLIGIALRRPGAVQWMGFTGIALSFAAGPYVVVIWGDNSSYGRSMSFLGPTGWLLTAVPLLADVHIWWRMASVAAVPAAIAAAIGLSGLMAWLRARLEGRPNASRSVVTVAVVAMGAVLVDQTSYPASLAFPAATFSPAIPPGVADVVARLTPGMLVMLPLQEKVAPDNFDETSAGRYLLWQLQHGYPISASEPTRQDNVVDENELMGALRMWGQMASLGQRPLVPLRLQLCANLWAMDMRARGLSGIVIVTAVGYGEWLMEPMRVVFGPPHVSATGAAGWDLAHAYPNASRLPERSNCSSWR